MRHKRRGRKGKRKGWKLNFRQGRKRSKFYTLDRGGIRL